MVVCEELGRGLVNAPYTAAALMAPCCWQPHRPKLQADWLPRMASGEALVVPALQERAARYRLNHVATRATRRVRLALDGGKCVVPAGDEADAWIVPARVSGAECDTQGIGLFLVERAAGQVAAYATQDGAARPICNSRALPPSSSPRMALHVLQPPWTPALPRSAPRPWA
jgi:alkylation response protein AidB-like acyl-CoA dehydrogenase